MFVTTLLLQLDNYRIMVIYEKISYKLITKKFIYIKIKQIKFIYFNEHANEKSTPEELIYLNLIYYISKYIFVQFDKKHSSIQSLHV